MNKQKAEKKIRRKITRAKLCPFCGNRPKFEVYCDNDISPHGSFGHYAKRKGCCQPTKAGQTELFFTNNFAPPNYWLWWQMLSALVNDWNRRV
jgi:hypothetical protein